MYTLSSFDYEFPSELIAQVPIEPRDQSKLLIVDRKHETFQDAHFYDLRDLLTSNDVIVLNDTKVFPARLIVYLLPNKKPIELLLEKEVALSPTTITWDVLTKPGLKIGDQFTIPGTTSTGTCIAINGYLRRIELPFDRESLFAFLNTWAQTPVPPYIHWEPGDESYLKERYQTVYAKKQGAVAAPTAGLHFTKELLNALRKKGVEIYTLTLHVGLGTFLPVKTQDITQHHMHSEWYELNTQTAASIQEAKRKSKRIIAIGTTTVRVLETCTDEAGTIHAGNGETNIYIYPPYGFRCVDSLITNFHIPKSTLLMLVSALASYPNTQNHFTTFKDSLIGNAYRHAVNQAYRFYSFGDSMWIR